MPSPTKAKPHEDIDELRRLAAIGQGTARLAHDFNNLLTVILGSARRMRRHLGHPEQVFSKEEITKSIEFIETAALKGAETVRGMSSMTHSDKEQDV